LRWFVAVAVARGWLVSSYGG
jgi:hypothetical protein